MVDFKKGFGRRSVLKGIGISGAALATPSIFTSSAWSAGYLNEPKGDTVTFGFNVPQTGAYADEGADELRAYNWPLSTSTPAAAACWTLSHPRC